MCLEVYLIMKENIQNLISGKHVTRQNCVILISTLYACVKGTLQTKSLEDINVLTISIPNQ